MNATASETSIGQTVPVGPPLSRTVPAVAYIGASVCVALATLIGEIIIGYFDIATLTLLYLLPVLASALRWGRGPSLFASFLGVLALDFFFVPPLYSFAVANHKDLAALAIFLLVGIVTGSMATKARSEAEKTRQREKRNLALYSLSRQMASEADLDKLAGSFARTAAESTAGKVSIIMPEKDGRGLREVASYPARNSGLDEKEHAVIQWVLGWGRPAGRGTDTLRDASELIFPAKADGKTVAALAIDLDAKTEALPPEQVRLIEAFANLAAVAIMRIKLSQEAERAQWLAESEKLHRALLNSISHDLRTPIASVMGAVTGLLDEEGAYDMQTTKSFLEMIRDGALRLNRFVANLLDMARLESDTLRLRKEWHDIQDIIGVSLKEMAESLREHAIATDIPPDLPLVEVDFGLIEHVMINLLENSVKYSPPGSEIGIEVRQVERALLVTVSDMGQPIPDGEREHVFDKFYRLEYAKSMDGTGLGLSICRGIVEGHGGMIWLDRSPGPGNRFTFSLPLPGREGKSGEEEGGARGIRAARILVVDDEKQIRRILAASLASRGNEVVEAASGGEAVSRTALNQPDLIILDLGLPDIDGIEVIRRVREFTQTPIIILSVREGEEDKIEALNAGADDYVTKPFAMGELLARVRVALRRAFREEDEGVIVNGDMTVDLGRHLITARGQKVRLSVTEYEILRYLALNRGKVVTHGQLLRAVRGHNHQEDSHYIRVYIAQLRHKIESDPNHPTHIITESGVGYRMANGD